jgi:hypothetical protein
LSKCQKSRLNQQARIGLNKIDRRRAEAALRVVIAARVPKVAAIAATVVAAPVAIVVVIVATAVAIAADASMARPKSISISS